MKFVIISDTHGQHGKLSLPEGDVLVHCGDFSATGNLKDHHSIASWMGKQNFKYKLCTAGNHDRYAAVQPIPTKQFFDDNNVHFLINESIEIEGLNIYMSPYTPRYGNWFFMKERGEDIAKVWKLIPPHLDLLVAHGMPYGILDSTIYSSERVGCMDLRDAITEKKPRYFAGGHLHLEGGTTTTVGDTTFVNAAICNESYKPVNKIIELEINNEQSV